jgi:hypothetical protein
LHVKITNEDNAHQLLCYQGYCSLWIHSTRLNGQPSLLCGNTEAVSRNCVWKKVWTWPNDQILHHDNAPAHKVLSSSFSPKKSKTEMEHPPCSRFCSECLMAVTKNEVYLKGKKISRYWRHLKKNKKKSKKERERDHGTENYSTTGVPKIFATVAAAQGEYFEDDPSR